MAKWFRSEPMEYVSLILNEDAAHDCLADLGKMGILQFTDLNPDQTPFQRRYVKYVKRCDELERKLRFFYGELNKFDLEATTAGSVDAFLEESVGTQKIDPMSSLEALEKELEVYENQLRELNSYNEQLTHEFNEKVELQEVLEKARNFYEFDRSELSGKTRLDIMRFNCIAGVVSTEEKVRFDRMIFRTTRGNSLVRFAPIDHSTTDPQSGRESEKSVFLIFYKSATIENKLKKICDAFLAHRYMLPDMDDLSSVQKLLDENRMELIDSRTVLLKNRETRYKLCKKLSLDCEKWSWVVLKEKAVYHTMNMLKADVAGMLRGEGWVIKENLGDAIDAVDRAHSSMDLAMPSLVSSVSQPWPTPPTHFVTNKFTYAYQEFVNTYGIPRYREANPALFTAATFPFLFGVMYGDVGHGSFLFLTGLYLVWNEKKTESGPKPDELTGGMHAARYMLVMMGFFAVYAGLLYNDCFSLGLDLFGSRYHFEGQEDRTVEQGDVAELIAEYGSDDAVYPFGLDPIWHVASNELLFFNSFKMKLSVILGIFQMCFGIFLRGMNAVFFKEPTDLYYEVIPMVVFASSLFIYMVFMIFLKWSIDWNERMSWATCYDPTGDEWQSDWTSCNVTDGGNGFCTPMGYPCADGDTTADKCPLDFGGAGDGCQPPVLITSLINIALSPGVVDEPLYKGQAGIQVVLLILAMVSVPILLVAKPFAMKQQHEEVVHHADDENEHEEEEEHSFMEIIIHQAIETIEFVLGMVSNTASYLRLWALSLAHSELAQVFWQKCMLSTLPVNFFATYIGFALFAGVTFGVLLAMDVLECFLHALRLHWVEFQSKFFKADGIRFAPYSFKQIIVDSM
jgi:V-type H+-transporting ATPase subunit a